MVSLGVTEINKIILNTSETLFHGVFDETIVKFNNVDTISIIYSHFYSLHRRPHITKRHEHSKDSERKLCIKNLLGEGCRGI